MGCRVDDVDTAAATERIIALSAGAQASHVVTLGTEMVVYAQRDATFRAIVNASALAVCDTVGLLWAARRAGARLRERVTGVELVERVCAEAARLCIPLYLLGGIGGVAQSAAQRLCERYPGLVVAGTRCGYFDEDLSAGVAAAVRESGARILLCGLGSPRQELWLAEHLRDTACGVGIGVGGSFDVLSDRVRRAPATWRRLGLEWLYRLTTQPHRWRRQLALPLFVGLVALDALRLRRAAP
ncbi:MAG: WecB/TagA/CpsF family glycosyltransferase [Candidatus Tyrphobacter sp.]